MRRCFFVLGFLCCFLWLNAQNYRGSDADRMREQQYQQHAKQNSGGNSYQPNYGGGGSYNYGSRSYNNGNNRNYNNNYSSNQFRSSETVIQGAFDNNGQTALCLLKYSGGRITHYAVSKTYNGQYDWQSIYPDNPHPTNSIQDGNWARSYSYKVSIGGTNVYFNMNDVGSNRNDSGYGNSNETLLQGVFIYNGQQNLVVLRYFGGKITHYAVSKDAMGNYDWQSMYPDNPHPTNSIQDGSMASAYRYKVSVQGTNIYFNMQ